MITIPRKGSLPLSSSSIVKLSEGCNLQHLVELLEIATKNQLFQFEGNLYEQVDGVAMGSPLGPLMANAFMCNIEEKLKNQDKMPAFYKRYVDDTLSKMPDVSSASEFLLTLNEIHPSLSSNSNQN